MPHYLVLQLARFGDIVQTKRLLLTLCARGTVHLGVDASLADLARMLYPYAHIHGLRVHGAPDSGALAHNAAIFAQWRGEPWDEVYNLNHSPLNGVLARLFAPEIVQGYAMHGAQAVHAPWVRMAFGWTGKRPLAPLNLADFWAHFARQPVPPTAVNPVAKGQGRGLGVVLAGRESRRSLPPEVLGPCVYAAFEALGGVPIYLFGTGAEKPLARQLLRHLPGSVLGQVHNLAGKTDWPGLADALTGLDALLSPDTGTMHLAAHLGVPVRAFFLSSAWCFETGPYGAGHILWQAQAPCLPCLESAPCPLHEACAKPFVGPAFLRSVAAHTGDLPAQAWLCPGGTFAGPEGPQCAQGGEDAGEARLTLLHSTLDSLGTFWQGPAMDALAPQRTALRHLVAEYLNLGTAGRGPDAAHLLPPLAEHLYTEGEWMLAPRDSIFAESCGRGTYEG